MKQDPRYIPVEFIWKVWRENRKENDNLTNENLNEWYKAVIERNALLDLINAWQREFLVKHDEEGN